MSSSYNGPLPGVRIPMSAVLKWGTVGSVVVMVLAAGVGWLVDGSAGMWGAILGIAIPVAFYSITVIVALVTLRVRPEVFGAAILGSWVVKIAVLIGVLAALSNADFYSRGAFFVAFVVGTVGYLVAEALIVVKTRVPFIEPRESTS
ncbi:MAG TPA: hypothetical protein VGP37_09245 [Candidatus Nanopelagicales bacterium]|nr:hypothetical protein [Candidatus Nanopelagicales bacterium]